MAHGSVSYSKPDTGSLAEYLAKKVKDAAQMSAEERKAANEKAEQQRAEGVPEEDIQKYDKGYFFGKALSHEFGGDLIRRTKGTFSNDPTESEDPALSKRQRFSALLGSDIVKPEPFKQLELPLNTGGNDKNVVNVEDKSLKSWLSVAFDNIQKSYDNIADKIGALSSKEKGAVQEEIKNTKSLTKITSGLTTIKNFFNKNNDLQEEENKTENQQLDFFVDQKESNDLKQIEARLESGQDLSGSVKYSDPYAQDEEDDEEDSGNRSFMDRMFDFDVDKRGRRRRRGVRRRYARRKFNNFRRGVGRSARRLNRRGRVGFARGLRSLPKLSEGGIAPSGTTLTPQSQTPEAKNNIVPTSKPVENKTLSQKPQQNSVQPQQKLARGGIVDNPTKTVLQPGQAVIPLNRNNPVKKAFQEQKPKATDAKTSSGKTVGDSLGKALQLPTTAAGGLLLSTMTEVFKNLGGVGKIIGPFLSQMFSPLARVFGLPAGIIGSLLGGGSAEAATLDSKGIADFLKGDDDKKKGKGKRQGGGGGGGGGNPPSGTPGSLIADLEADVGKNAAEMKDEIMSTGGAGIGDPTKQAWCADYVNSQLQRNGIQGSGSPAANSFENWGSPVDKNNIQPGDVIVGDYGGGSKSHVMFAIGTPKDGYVDLIGGNQSGKVTKGSIALSKIDYARRATVGAPGTTPVIANPSVQPGTRTPTPNSNTRGATSASNTTVVASRPKAKPKNNPQPPPGVSHIKNVFSANPSSPNYIFRW